MKNLEYSSKSQAENGTDNTTIMTPLRVKQSIAANAGGSTGTTDYTQLTNKPKINGVELNGNKTAQDLGIQGNVQADWNESDPTNDAYINNKPTIPTVPTNVSAFTNDAGYLTSETDPIFAASVAAGITQSNINNWNSKQDALVSGTNIKTINNQSLLGSGNITIQGGASGVYFFDGQNTAANVAMINDICDAWDNGDEVHFTGKFVDGDTGQIFHAPINITKYTGANAALNNEAAFISDPVYYIEGVDPYTQTDVDGATDYTIHWSGYTDQQKADFLTQYGFSSETDLIKAWDVAPVDNPNGEVTLADVMRLQTLMQSGAFRGYKFHYLTFALYLEGSWGNFTSVQEFKTDDVEVSSLANVQADWNETDTTADDYIKNKPTVPTRTSQLTNDGDQRMPGTYNGYALTNGVGNGIHVLWNRSTGVWTVRPVFEWTTGKVLAFDDEKQDTLVSGTNIKTVNGNSLLGSGNLVISGGGSQGLRGCVVGQSGYATGNPYYKFASISFGGAWNDRTITFKVSQVFGDNNTCLGILTAHVRTNGSNVVEGAQLSWEYGNDGVDENLFTLCYKSVSGGDTTVELYAKCSVAYTCYHFDVISESDRTSRLSEAWTLYTNITDNGGASNLPSGYTSVASTFNVIKNAVPYADRAYRATNATNATNVNFTENNPSNWTTYRLPFIGDSGTGAKALYNNDGFKCTSQQGTTSTEGAAVLRLGNGTARGSNGNKTGHIYLHSANGAVTDILGTSTGSRTVYFPDKGGTVAMTSDIPSLPSTTTGSISLTNTSGSNGTLDYVIYGKVLFAELSFTTKNSSTAVGNDCYQGTIGNAAYRPTGHSAELCGYYGSTALICTISTSGGISVRTTGASIAASKSANVRGTYIIP